MFFGCYTEDDIKKTVAWHIAEAKRAETVPAPARA